MKNTYENLYFHIFFLYDFKLNEEKLIDSILLFFYLDYIDYID